MTGRMILNPKRLDTMVAANLHVDVLSDLVGALTRDVTDAITGAILVSRA